MFIRSLYPDTKKALDKLISLNLLDQFYLAGGTALALQLGHRRSIDLDFFSDKEFKSEQILQTLSKIAEFSVIRQEADTLTGQWLQTRLEFFYYPYKLLEPLIEWEEIKFAGIKDIALMKMIAISNRGTKKNFVDLYEISQQTDLEELFTYLPQKFERVKYDKYQLLKSLVYFEDAEDDPELDMIKEISWLEVKDFFIEKVKTIELD